MEKFYFSWYVGFGGVGIYCQRWREDGGIPPYVSPPLEKREITGAQFDGPMCDLEALFPYGGNNG